MAIIKCPVPYMSIKDLKEVYKNRKSHNLVSVSWKEFKKRYYP